jgi:hypothetical protein
MSAVRVLFIDDNIYDALHRQASNLLGVVIDFDNRTKNIFINEFFTVSRPTGSKYIAYLARMSSKQPVYITGITRGCW